MKLWQPIKKLFTNKTYTGYEERGIGESLATKTSQGGFGYLNPILKQAGITLSTKDLNQQTLNNLEPGQIRNIIRRSNSIVAKALSDFTESVTGGFTWTADKNEPDRTAGRAHVVLTDWFERMQQDDVGLEVKLEQISNALFIDGAVFTETIIDTDGRTPVTLKVLDPSTARFRKAKDPIIGDYYELGQDQGFSFDRPAPRIVAPGGYQNFVSLHNEPTIQYKPIQSEPNDPYGTGFIDAAIVPVLMLTSFLDALSVGFTKFVSPNTLVTINKEKFKEFLGSSNDSDLLETKFDGLLKKITDTIDKMGPGDTLVYGDDVEIGGTFTNQGRSPLGSLKEIVELLTRMIIQGVRSQPIFMGLNEGNAETHAVQQRKSYGRLIRRSQQPINATITYSCNLVLVLNDLPPLAEFTLAYENTAEFLDQAMAFSAFQQGLLTESQSESAFILSLEQAKEAEYITEEEAQARYDEMQQIRRAINIIPQGL